MNDQYRIDHSPEEPPTRLEGGADRTDTVLWVVLAAGVAGNTGLQLAGHQYVAIPFGTAAAASAIALIVRYVQRRRK